MASIVNHIIRLDATEGSAQSDSVHEAWLQALTSADGVVHATGAQLQQLRRQVAEWHRPIAVAANSPFRLVPTAGRTARARRGRTTGRSP